MPRWVSHCNINTRPGGGRVGPSRAIVRPQIWSSNQPASLLLQPSLPANLLEKPPENCSNRIVPYGIVGVLLTARHPMKAQLKLPSCTRTPGDTTINTSSLRNRSHHTQANIVRHVLAATLLTYGMVCSHEPEPGSEQEMCQEAATGAEAMRSCIRSAATMRWRARDSCFWVGRDVGFWRSMSGKR